MRIKRYEAPTIQEALVKVKKDLGPEAVILYTKTFRKGGMWGFFGKPMAEITAGVDLNLLEDVGRRNAPSASLQTAVIEKPRPSLLKVPMSTGIPGSTLIQSSVDSARSKVKVLQRELNEMKTSAYSNVLRDFGHSDHSTLFSEGLGKLKKKLARQEIEEFLIQRILKGLMNEKVEADRKEEVYPWIRKFVTDILKSAPEIKLDGFSKVMVFVGPTGVGKTTTLAKLAARFSLMQRKKVAMITADTYRIAATDQLRTYGRIMGIPVEVANSAEEIPDILSKHKNLDLILLDTAGRSPSNDEQMEELKKLVTYSQPDEIHLVISATTKYYDMIRIIERFGVAVPINRMIFTKLDETRFYGAFLNLMNNFQIPLSYYSIGQNVPDDLEVPEVHSLAERITQVILS